MESGKKETPKFFYKYRSVNCAPGELGSDISLLSLERREAYFSGRKAFNDLFDADITYTKPKPRQVKEIKDLIDKNQRRYVSRLIKNGAFTAEGLSLFQDLRAGMESKLDEYLFYCLSATPLNELMWTHYGGNHSGFCIEFKAEFIRADEVIYTDKAPEFDLFMAWKDFMLGVPLEESTIGELTWRALRTKKMKWSYESEFRLMAGKKMSMERLGGGGALFRYSHSNVNSIIFGCRTTQAVKNHVAKIMPDEIGLKEVIKSGREIKIVDLSRA